MAEERDFWDKVDILLKPIGSIIAGLLVAGLGLMGRDYFEEKNRVDTNARIYAELVSRREVSESALRADMFGRIIENFLGPAKSGSDGVLNLEILAYNFHESLDLTPLFKAVRANVQRDQAALDNTAAGFDVAWREHETYLDRLERVARDVTFKQISALEDGGNVASGLANFRNDEGEDKDQLDELGQPDQEEQPALEDMEEEEDGDCAVLDNPAGCVAVMVNFAEEGYGEHAFQVEVLRVYELEREVKIRLVIWVAIRDSEGEIEDWREVNSPVFRLGFYDFPMIDNTRLTGGYRSAVVLNDFDENSARISLVYFPASKASLKDKPYYDEILDQLRKTNEKTADAEG